MGAYIIHFDDKPWQDLDDEQYYRCKEIPWFFTTKTTISRLTPYTEPDMEQVRKEAYEKGWKEAEDHYEKGYNDGYDTGLSHAWEVARKINVMDSCTRDEIFGLVITSNITDTFSASEAIEKIRQYEQGKEGRITKGDVVRMKSAPEIEILVTYEDEAYVGGIALTKVDDSCEIGDQFTDIVIHKVEKTGRHYEIEEVLRKIREG